MLRHSLKDIIAAAAELRAIENRTERVQGMLDALEWALNLISVDEISLKSIETKHFEQPVVSKDKKPPAHDGREVYFMKDPWFPGRYFMSLTRPSNCPANWWVKKPIGEIPADNITDLQGGDNYFRIVSQEENNKPTHRPKGFIDWDIAFYIREAFPEFFLKSDVAENYLENNFKVNYKNKLVWKHPERTEIIQWFKENPKTKIKKDMISSIFRLEKNLPNMGLRLVYRYRAHNEKGWTWMLKLEDISKYKAALAYTRFINDID